MSKVYRGVGNNKLLPLTSMMCLELEDGVLTLRTYDGENFVIVQDKEDVVAVDEKFYAVVNADVINKLISKITKEFVEFTVANDGTLLISGNGNYRIEVIYDNGMMLKYPDAIADFNKMAQESYTINKEVLAKSVKINESSAAKTREIVAHTGAYFGKEIITTDSVLACIVNSNLVKGKNLLFSYSSLHLYDLFENEKLELKVAGNNFMISCNMVTVVGKFLDGIEDYPATQVLSLIDGEMDSVEINVTELKEVLDRLDIFVGEYDNNGIKINFAENLLTLTSLSNNATEIIKLKQPSTKPFTASVALEPLKIQLASITDQNVWLDYGTDTMVRLRSTGATYILALLTE